jgi:tetratricopeptide (TPR) repeat protein
VGFHRFLPIALLLFFIGACSHTEERVSQANGFMKMGISFLHSNNCTEALRYFLEAEKLHADDADLQNLLGLAYFCKNEYDLAAKAYRRAVEMRSDFSEAWNNLGAAYLALGRLDDAIAAFDNALKNLLYQTPERAWLNKGDAYAARFDTKNAVASYQKAVNIAMPKSYARDVVCVAHSREGQVHIRDKRYVDAVRSLQASVKLCPKFAEPHYHLSTAYQRLGKKDEAVKACQKVQSLAPETREAQACANFIDLLRVKVR